MRISRWMLTAPVLGLLTASTAMAAPPAPPVVSPPASARSKTIPPQLVARACAENHAKIKASERKRDQLARAAAAKNPRLAELIEARGDAWRRKNRLLEPMIAASGREGEKAVKRLHNLRNKQQAVREQLAALQPGPSAEREALTKKRDTLQKKLDNAAAAVWGFQDRLARKNADVRALLQDTETAVTAVDRELEAAFEDSDSPTLKAASAELAYLRAEQAYLESLPCECVSASPSPSPTPKQCNVGGEMSAVRCGKGVPVKDDMGKDITVDCPACPEGEDPNDSEKKVPYVCWDTKVAGQKDPDWHCHCP